MCRILFTSILFLGLGSWARGVSVEVPVTPANLDQHPYLFSVIAKRIAGGVAFTLKISAKTNDIYSDSSTNVSIVTHTGDRRRIGSTIEPVKPTVAVSLTKEARDWDANFTISDELLKKPGLCFVFTEIARANFNGRPEPVSAATFYEIKLSDFVGR
jgi:hypothetical protein